MNSKQTKTVRAQLRHAKVQYSDNGWQCIKRAFDRGARTTAQLTKSLCLLKDGAGQLWAVTPREEADLRSAVVAQGQKPVDAVDAARASVRTFCRRAAWALFGLSLCFLALLVWALLQSE